MKKKLNFRLVEMEIDPFNDIYYQKKLSQLNQNIGFCSSLSEFSFAYKKSMEANPHQKDSSITYGAHINSSLIGMIGLSYQKLSNNTLFIKVWGIYMSKIYRAIEPQRALLEKSISTLLQSHLLSMYTSESSVIIDFAGEQMELSHFLENMDELIVSLESNKVLRNVVNPTKQINILDKHAS